VILFEKFGANLSVPSLNIRLKGSHRERVISLLFSRILPDLRGTRRQKLNDDKPVLQLGFILISDPDLKFRPAHISVPIFSFG